MVSVSKRIIFIITLIIAPAIYAAKYKLNSVTVMNLAPSQNQIIVKLPNNNIEVVKVGHFISGTRVKLSKVFSGRALVEAIIENKGEQSIKKYWIYKAKGGRSFVESA